MLLHFLFAIAIAILVAERWRARSTYGVKRGLPPGSLTLFPRGPWVDDRFYLNEAKRWGPIFKCSLLHRPCVCILGARLGAELLRAHPDDFEAPRVRFNRFVAKGFLRYMEPSDHGHYKPPFRAALAPAVLREVQPVLREIVRNGLPRLAPGARIPGSGIAPRPVLRDIVFEMLVATFYGLRSDHPDFTWLQARYDDLDLRKISLLPEHRDRAALAEIMQWVRTRGRALPDPGAAWATGQKSSVLTALCAANPRVLEDETALGNVIYAVTIGRADLTALLMWVLNLLGDARDWGERLRKVARSQPENEANALAWRIVCETLRLEQSEYVYRRAKREVQFHGFRIPRDWRVRVLIREGHRDPAHFPDPERFDPDRWLERKPGTPFQPFGIDAHACIGASVTELLTCLVLTELARNYDWDIVSNGPREYGWAHWQPSSKLRIVFAPISSA
jgi:cytochrome P450